MISRPLRNMLFYEFLSILIYLSSSVVSKSLVILEDKSNVDGVSVRGIVLGNGLRVILVSNNQAKFGGASLHVGVGSLHNPPEAPGLSHLVEHALMTQDNEKNPNGFGDFVLENVSGDAEAGLDYTAFYYSVLPSVLNESLQRFASVFLSPEFDETALESQVEAVNSEYESLKTNDEYRDIRVNSVTLKKDHPFTRFRAGSKQSLLTNLKKNGTKLLDKAVEFFNKYYSANIMTLAVVGPQSLNELQQMVETYFSALPNKNIARPHVDELPYGPENLKTITEVEPICDKNELKLQFFFKNDINLQNMVNKYVSPLVQRSGPGSLLSYLKKSGWASRIFAYAEVPYRDFLVFEIKISVTEEGLDNYQKVLCAVFQYLGMLEHGNDPKSHWKHDLNAVTNRFSSPEYSTEVNTVKHISKYLQHNSFIRAIKEFLGQHNDDDFKPNALNLFINDLTPDNFRLQVTSKRFEGKMKYQDGYLGINYNHRRINESLIEDLKLCRHSVNSVTETETMDSVFYFPQKNDYIPTNFTLNRYNEVSYKDPKIIHKTKLSTVWYAQDHTFKTPRAVILGELYSPIADADPKNVALNHLFAKYLMESLMNDLEPAVKAGLKHEITASEHGLQISLKWFNEKIHHVLNLIAEKVVVTPTQIDPLTFQLAKHNVLEYLCQEEKTPCNLARDDYVVLEKYFTPSEIRNCVKDISIADFGNFIRSFLSRMHLTWFFTGNLLADVAIGMSQNMEDRLLSIGTQGLLAKELVRYREVEIPEGTSWQYSLPNSIHSRSCTKVMFQNPSNSNKANVMVKFLKDMIHKYVFQQIRTKEALAYKVGSDHKAYHRHGRSLYVLVNTGYDPAYVASRIHNFFRIFRNTLNSMSTTKYDELRSKFSRRLKALSHDLYTKSYSQWEEIITGSFQFNRYINELHELENVSYHDFINFYEDLIGLTPGTGRKLTVFSVPESYKNSTQLLLMEKYNRDERETIYDLPAWKASMKLFPYQHYQPLRVN